MALPTVTNKKLMVANDRLKNLRAKLREGAEEVQSMAMSGVGAFGAPFVAHKFLPKGQDGQPRLLGMPGTLGIGLGAYVAGMLADSEPLSNIGKGALYAAAAEAGKAAATSASK